MSRDGLCKVQVPALFAWSADRGLTPARVWDELRSTGLRRGSGAWEARAEFPGARPTASGYPCCSPVTMRPGREGGPRVSVPLGGQRSDAPPSCQGTASRNPQTAGEADTETVRTGRRVDVPGRGVAGPREPGRRCSLSQRGGWRACGAAGPFRPAPRLRVRGTGPRITPALAGCSRKPWTRRAPLPLGPAPTSQSPHHLRAGEEALPGKGPWGVFGYRPLGLGQGRASGSRHRSGL